MPEGKLNDVSVRLRAVGLQPTVVKQLVNLIDRMERDHGQEWSSGWLKSMKVDFVRLLADQEPVGRYAKKGIRINGKLIRVPKGPFGYLFRLGLMTKSRRKLHMVWQGLIAYTRYTNPDVSFSQWRKFSTAVRKPLPRKRDLRVAQTYVSMGLQTLPKSGLYAGVPQPLMTTLPREGKRIPLGRRTRPERDILHNLKSALTYNVFQDDVRQDLIEPVVAGTPWSSKVKGHPVTAGVVRPLHHVGTIGFLQEPGCKLRAVANPNRVFQRALQPLGEFAFSWLGKIPEDHCYHQEKGVFVVQGVLGARRSVAYSFDLSNATDVFPYALMDQTCAFARVPRSARKLLSGVSRGTWQVPFGYSVSRKVRVLQWNRGMPLGLFPCYAIFSLAHHALVRGICVKKGKYTKAYRDAEGVLHPPTFPYVLLGDDIVIFDDDYDTPEDSVALEYKRVLDVIGCPIAMEKSLVSDHVAEFAGRVILPHIILHGLKYRQENDNSFLEQVKSMGPRVIPYLLPRQRHVAQFLAELPEPWGYGYNPRGRPFLERLAEAMAWELSAPRKSESESVVRIRAAMRNWYSYKYSESSGYTAAGFGPRSSSWDPLSIDLIESRPQFLGQPVEAFIGHIEERSHLGQRDGGLKGELLVELRAKLNLLSRGPVYDHPYSKPLVQSLYPRVRRAQKLAPTVLAFLSQDGNNPSVDEVVDPRS